jgi:hypothetical protein
MEVELRHSLNFKISIIQAIIPLLKPFVEEIINLMD